MLMLRAILHFCRVKDTHRNHREQISFSHDPFPKARPNWENTPFFYNSVQSHSPSLLRASVRFIRESKKHLPGPSAPDPCYVRSCTRRLGMCLHAAEPSHQETSSGELQK